LKGWTTADCRNTPSAANLEEEEIVDAPGNDGNASMTEQVKRPNPWRKMMMMMMMMQKEINQINLCASYHLKQSISTSFNSVIGVT